MSEKSLKDSARIIHEASRRIPPSGFLFEDPAVIRERWGGFFKNNVSAIVRYLANLEDALGKRV